MLNKKSFRILKYIYRHKSVSRKQLLKKFSKIDAASLLDGVLAQYVFVDNYYTYEKGGFTYHKICDSSTYSLNADGESYVESHQWFNAEYVESHQWFNAEYVVSHILVPTILAIITTLITLTLTNALSPSQQTIQEFHTQQELHSPEEMP